jgi:hypothetical protein
MDKRSVLDEQDTRLQAAREAFPDWDIFRVFAGYMAVPKDTPVFQSVDIDGITAKLRRAAE